VRIERLRDCLNRELAAALLELPTADAPLVVTRRLLRSAVRHRPTDEARSGETKSGATGREPGSDTTYALARNALVRTSFRRLVSTGTVGHPFDDGIVALESCGQLGVVERVRRLTSPERTALRVEVDRLGRDLAGRWPRLDPRWLPRTGVPMRVRLLDGAVILSCRPDLLVGWPDGREGSVGVVDISSDEYQAVDRTRLSFLVLVETLRSAAPPFVGATYYAQTGEIAVMPITYQVAEDAARDVVDAITTAVGLRTGVTGRSPEPQVRDQRTDHGGAQPPTGQCAPRTNRRAHARPASPGDLRPPARPPSPRRSRR